MFNSAHWFSDHGSWVFFKEISFTLYTMNLHRFCFSFKEMVLKTNNSAHWFSDHGSWVFFKEKIITFYTMNLHRFCFSFKEMVLKTNKNYPNDFLSIKNLLFNSFHKNIFFLIPKTTIYIVTTGFMLKNTIKTCSFSLFQTKSMNHPHRIHVVSLISHSQGFLSMLHFQKMQIKMNCKFQT